MDNPLSQVTDEMYLNIVEHQVCTTSTNGSSCNPNLAIPKFAELIICILIDVVFSSGLTRATSYDNRHASQQGLYKFSLICF